MNQLPVPTSISPKVFISSTVNEFRDIRSALAHFLRQQGATVYLSEAVDFPVTGDRSATEQCFQNIRNSDYYILIIGKARGALYDNGVSVTRQEYRVAKNSLLTTGELVP